MSDPIADPVMTDTANPADPSAAQVAGSALTRQPAGFKSHASFDKHKKRSTLYHHPLPAYPPAAEEFEFEPNLQLPAELHNIVESNANKGENLAWELSDYHTRSNFDTQSLVGLVAAWNSLNSGLSDLETRLNSKAMDDRAPYLGEIERMRKLLQPYQPCIEKIALLGPKGVYNDNADVPHEEFTELMEFKNKYGDHCPLCGVKKTWKNR